MSRFRKYLLVAAAVMSTVAAALSEPAQAQSLTLVVNPYSGVTSIQNNTAGSLSIDGYQILSSSGSLLPDPTHTNGVGWDSLANAGLPGWMEVAPTTAALSELDLSGSATVAAGAELNLGHAFVAAGPHDLQWKYSSPGSGGTETVTSPGAIQYAGGLQLLVVTQLGAGNTVVGTRAVLFNQESVSLNVDAYTIQSASGSLNPAGFSGFSGHSATGWQSVAPSATALSELNLTSSSTLTAGTDVILGSAVTNGATHDLSLVFHAVGPSPEKLTGVVTYLSQLSGDVNNDGIVNGQDIALISSNWLHANKLPGDANFDGIVNGQDIALISSNWLLSSPGGGEGTMLAPVPEPQSLALAGIGLVAGLITACGHRRRRAQEATRSAMK
ncbi:MAG: dockerin type I domain-containing protein [Singulisphaera sp.]